MTTEKQQRRKQPNVKIHLNLIKSEQDKEMRNEEAEFADANEHLNDEIDAVMRSL